MANLIQFFSSFFNKKQEYHILKDVSIRKELERKSVIKLPLLSDEEVNELSSYFDKINASPKLDYGGFYTTSDSFKKEKNIEIDSKIQEVIRKPLSKYFNDFNIHQSYFFVKPPSENQNTYPHQDWFFVEKEFPSYNIWIPLKDITKDNGALGILHGSHHFNKDLNPAPAGATGWSLSPYSEDLLKDMTTYEMKAGEILIFYTNTIHASLPNNNKSTRASLGMGITHQEAQRILYYTEPKNSSSDKITIGKYVIPTNYHMEYGNAKLWELHKTNTPLPHADLKEKITYQVPSISQKEVMRIIRKYN